MNQFSLTARPHLHLLPPWQVSILHIPSTSTARRSSEVKEWEVAKVQQRQKSLAFMKHQKSRHEAVKFHACLVGHAFWLGVGWLVWITVRWFDFYIVSGRWDEVSSVGSMIKCGWGRQMDDGMSFCWWSLMGSKWCLRKSYLLFVGHMCAALLPSSKHECSMLGGMLHWPYRIYYWKQESSGPSTGHVDHKLNYIQLYSVYRIIHRSCPQIVQTFMVEW